MSSTKATKKSTARAARAAKPAKKSRSQKAPGRASKKGKRKRMSTATRRVSETLMSAVTDQLLTLAEAADQLGCSPTYLRWLCNFRHESHVPFARKVGRNWFVPESRLADIPLDNKGITGRPKGSGAGRKPAGAKRSGAKKAAARKAGSKKAGRR